MHIQYCTLLVSQLCVGVLSITMLDSSFFPPENDSIKQPKAGRRLLQTCASGTYYYNSACVTCPANMYCTNSVATQCPWGSNSPAGSASLSQCSATCNFPGANSITARYEFQNNTFQYDSVYAKALTLFNSPVSNTTSPFGTCYNSIYLNPLPAYSNYGYKNSLAQGFSVGNVNWGVTNGWSLCFWFYPLAVGSGHYEIMISMGDYLNNQIFIQAGNPTQWVWQNARNNAWQPGINFVSPYFQWTHLCGVQTGAVFAVYINGTLQGSETEGVWPNATTTVNTMGAGDPANDNGWPAFNGNFADVRMYNSSLSANDVLNVFNWNSCMWHARHFQIREHMCKSMQHGNILDRLLDVPSQFLLSIQLSHSWRSYSVPCRVHIAPWFQRVISMCAMQCRDISEQRRLCYLSREFILHPCLNQPNCLPQRLVCKYWICRPDILHLPDSNFSVFHFKLWVYCEPSEFMCIEWSISKC